MLLDNGRSWGAATESFPEHHVARNDTRILGWKLLFAVGPLMHMWRGTRAELIAKGEWDGFMKLAAFAYLTVYLAIGALGWWLLQRF